MLQRPDTPIGDGVVALVPLAQEHVDVLALLGNDPLVQRFTRIPDPFTRAEAEWWLGLYEEGWGEGTRAGFAIVDATTQRFLGMVGFVSLRLEQKEAEVGYVVAPEERGRGVAGRALLLVSRWGIGEVGLERIELRAEVENPASLAVAERCGYVREGVLRHVHLKGGRRGDLALYSLLARELA